MSSRPNSGSRTSTGHRRAESGGHHRHSSSNSGHNRSDSGQSVVSEQHLERKHGHHRSKSGVHGSEKDHHREPDLHKVEFRSTQGINADSQQYVRPTSLYPLKPSKDSGLAGPDALHPEREPIRFEINLVGAPPEVEQLVNNIKQVAEQFLYHWKTFPIILPSPVSQCDSFPTSQVSSDGSLGRCKTKYHLRDLFIAPSFDELDAVAVDAKGEPRKLTGKQLEYIRERGKCMSSNPISHQRTKMTYYYNHRPIYLLIYLLIASIFTNAEDLLDQYVKHVQLVNSDLELDSNTDSDVLSSKAFDYDIDSVYESPRHLTRTKRDLSSDIAWAHSISLDSDEFVVLRWQPRHQEILFRVEARTFGYVGIGFSPNGGMEGADIVVGWVDDVTQKAVLLDCHGVSKSLGSAPVRDMIDNYTLMRGEQNDTHTMIEFRRVLDTCDPDDYVLSGDTVRVIWALHNSDPRFEGEMVYHGEKRGVQSLHLFGPPPSARVVGEHTRNWDVELKNFKIPDTMDTIYWCKVFKAPTFNIKHHITGFEPIIGKNHSNMVHHMIMHECELDGSANIPTWENFAKEEGQLCYSNMPMEWEKCLTPLVAWAIGSKGEIFPNHIGLPLSNKKNSYYMLEVHFDNPQMKSASDTSGLRLRYTNKLRENEAGVLITGVAPSTLHFIPPYQKEYKTAGYCSLGCTKQTFPKDGVNVVSVMLHSHLAGIKLKLRHIRAGKELPPLAQDEHYDFNYQQSRALSQDTTILPGDGLITECTYSTEQRNKPTLGGYSTREEMCLAFVLYYPRTELAGCYSIPPVRYFFENLGVKEFYGRNMSEVERALLEGKIDSDDSPVSTQKPFESKPGDEMSAEANLRAIMALRNAKEYSIEGETSEQSVFEKLIIKEPAEFRNKTFMSHLQNIPYNETILTKKMEEYFYNGLHMTFCRKRDDSLAIKETIEKLPSFEPYENKESIQCSYKAKRAFTNGGERSLVKEVKLGFIFVVLCFII